MKSFILILIYFVSFSIVNAQNFLKDESTGIFKIQKCPDIKMFKGQWDTRSTSQEDKNLYDSIKLISLEIYLVDGTITRIYVDALSNSDTIRFTNAKAAISIASYRKRQNDILELTTNDKKYIHLGDVLAYEDQGEEKIIPDNIEFTLSYKPGFMEKRVGKSSRISIDLKAYSDFLGIFDNQDNGLIQLEGSLKILLHTYNIPNTKIYFCQYIQPYFGYSRLDNSYRYTDVLIDSTVDRMRMYRRSPFKFGVNINAFKYNTRSGHSIEINAGYQYNKVDLYKLSDSTHMNLSLHSVTLQLPMQAKITRGIKFKYIPTFYFQFPELSNTTNYLKSLSFNTIMQNEFSLNFNLAKGDKNNMVFIRFNMFHNLTLSGNNYYQLQIGYERSLSDLLKKLPI